MRWNPYKQASEACWIEIACLRSSKLGVEQEIELQSTPFQSFSSARASILQWINQHLLICPLQQFCKSFSKIVEPLTVYSLGKICAAFHICSGWASQLHSTLFTALDFSKEKKLYTCLGKLFLPCNCLLCLNTCKVFLWNRVEGKKSKSPLSVNTWAINVSLDTLHCLQPIQMKLQTHSSDGFYLIQVEGHNWSFSGHHGLEIRENVWIGFLPIDPDVGVLRLVLQPSFFLFL